MHKQLKQSVALLERLVRCAIILMDPERERIYDGTPGLTDILPLCSELNNNSARYKYDEIILDIFSREENPRDVGDFFFYLSRKMFKNMA